jgi:hypothetical protein
VTLDGSEYETDAEPPETVLLVVAVPTVCELLSVTVNVTVPALTVDVDVTDALSVTEASPYVAEAGAGAVVVDAWALTLIETVAGAESEKVSFVLKVNESLPL